MLEILFKSYGYKRALSILILFLASVAENVPALQPYREVLIAIGSALGVVGVGHAAISKEER